jgi:NhaP-type Na+/H+ or K+/H+ antiporter
MLPLLVVATETVSSLFVAGFTAHKVSKKIESEMNNINNEKVAKSRKETSKHAKNK